MEIMKIVIQDQNQDEQKLQDQLEEFFQLFDIDKVNSILFFESFEAGMQAAILTNLSVYVHIDNICGI